MPAELDEGKHLVAHIFSHLIHRGLLKTSLSIQELENYRPLSETEDSKLVQIRFRDAMEWLKNEKALSYSKCVKRRDGTLVYDGVQLSSISIELATRQDIGALLTSAPDSPQITNGDKGNLAPLGELIGAGLAGFYKAILS